MVSIMFLYYYYNLAATKHTVFFFSFAFLFAISRVTRLFIFKIKGQSNRPEEIH